MTIDESTSGLDALDRLSQQLLAAADAGGIRVAIAQTPTEQDAIHRLRHERVVEAGRLIVAPSHRGDPSHRIWGALFARAWLSMRGLGFSLLCGAASPMMVQRLRALGLPFEVLGAPRTYWGEQRVPVRLDPA